MQIKTFANVLIILITLTISLHAKPGDLDRAFGIDGKVITNVGSTDDVALDLAIQNDGKIVAVGYTKSSRGDHDFVVVRYNRDGTLDTSFGNNGIATNDIGNVDNEFYSVAIQEDDKIVAAGKYSDFNDGKSDDRFIIVRYDSNGSLDTSFGNDGIVMTDISNGQDAIYSIAIQNDGKIVAAGFSYKRGHGDDFAIARYNNDGSLDTTFGTNGIVVTDIGGSDDHINSIAIRNDGKIIVAGDSYTSSSTDFAVACYDENGTLDSSFGNGAGIVLTDLGDNEYAESIAIQNDGKIVTAGVNEDSRGSYSDIAVVRYNADGTLDNTFGNHGKVITDIREGYDGAYGIAIQKSGRIIAAGHSAVGSDYDFAIVAYNSDGSLDRTFGNKGIVITGLGTNSEGAISVAVQKDGKIVAVGVSGADESTESGDSDFTLIRYSVDSIPPFVPMYYLLQ